jgi:hypothetical protein
MKVETPDVHSEPKSSRRWPPTREPREAGALCFTLVTTSTAGVAGSEGAEGEAKAAILCRHPGGLAYRDGTELAVLPPDDRRMGRPTTRGRALSSAN